jgi:hypothetical protein
VTASDLTTLNAISLMVFILTGDRLKRSWRTAWLVGILATGILTVTRGFHD